jgi:hypothetical protein
LVFLSYPFLEPLALSNNSQTLQVDNTLATELSW